MIDSPEFEVKERMVHTRGLPFHDEHQIVSSPETVTGEGWKKFTDTGDVLSQNLEIFSEEAFSHPDYCQFKLPEFSAEAHANIVESENKRLQA